MTVIDFSDPKIWAHEVLNYFVELIGFTPEWEIKQRSDGDYLVFYLAKPNDRYFRHLKDALKRVSETNIFKERSTLIARPAKPANLLRLPETEYLRTVFSNSLTVDQHSFQDDFFSRYIPSVFGAEAQIMSNANHIVFGRRGSGKSSLLAYLMNKLRQNEQSFVWISMQTYAGRGDIGVIVNVFAEIVDQLLSKETDSFGFGSLRTLLSNLEQRINNLNSSDIAQLITKIRRALTLFSEKWGQLTVFIDDVHLIEKPLQAKLLGNLYSVARGNRVYLKASAIEQFSEIWDSNNRVGLETPHDAQVIRLDLNLTNPKKSLDHITDIMNAHAKYCGLPDIMYISGNDVLNRLVWVAAGVPRDALDIYGQAIAKALVKDQKKVSVTSINEASSQNSQEKLRSIEGQNETRELFERIKSFCMNENQINAFLVEIQNKNPLFNTIKELIAYRLLHLIDEGFTPSQAGKRHLALMLDYGFYIGVRAAKSVKVFQKEPRQPLAKELRPLPIFRLAQPAEN